MKFPWHSRRPAADFASTREVESRVAPGVRYRIATMTFARRLDLMRRVREIAGRLEYLAASADASDRMDAGLLRAEIDRVYLAWGLKGVSGLRVDGRAVEVEEFAALSPEELWREALTAIRAETGLSEEERKN